MIDALTWKLPVGLWTYEQVQAIWLTIQNIFGTQSEKVNYFMHTLTWSNQLLIYMQLISNANYMPVTQAV